MRWFKQDDGVIDHLAKVAGIVAVVFTVYVYFHTIYPVFLKEKELLGAKAEAASLRKSNEAQQRTIRHNDEHIRRQSRQIEGAKRRLQALQAYADQVAKESYAIRSALIEERSRVKQIRTAAVRSHLDRLRDHIVNKAISQSVYATLSSQPRFDIRAYTLEYIEEQRRYAPNASEEERSTLEEALTILEEFARNRLNEYSTYQDMFDLILFQLEKEQQSGS